MIYIAKTIVEDIMADGRLIVVGVRHSEGFVHRALEGTGDSLSEFLLTLQRISALAMRHLRVRNEMRETTTPTEFDRMITEVKTQMSLWK